MKKSSLIYIVYILVMIGIAFYLTILILEGRFIRTALMIKKLFTGELLKNGDQQTIIYEDVMVKDFLNKYKFWKQAPSPYESNERCIRVSSNNTPMSFRDYEYSVEKPNSTFRIVALGDSMTEGGGVRFNDSWPKQLEKKLNNLNGDKYEVLNFGKGGFNTEYEVIVFKEYGILYNPDMIILEFHDTDVQNLTRIEENTRKIYEEYKLGIRALPEDIDSSDEELIKQWFAYLAYAEELRQSLEKSFEENWKMVETPLLDLINDAKSFNIDLIVFAFDREPQQTAALERLSKEYNFTFLDLEQYIYSMPEEEVRLPDGHLNERGYDIISDKLVEGIIYLVD